MLLTQFDEHEGQRASPLMLLTAAFVLITGILLLPKLKASFAEAISNSPKSKLTIEERVKRAQEERRYELLENEAEALLQEVRGEFSDLQRSTNTLNRQVEAIVGVPLETAHLRTTQELDHAILKSKEFATIWSQILNARLTKEKIEYRDAVINDAHYHMEKRTLTDRDRTKLLDLADWIQHHREVLSDQRDKLIYIQTALHPDTSNTATQLAHEGD